MMSYISLSVAPMTSCQYAVIAIKQLKYDRRSAIILFSIEPHYPQKPDTDVPRPETGGGTTNPLYPVSKRHSLPHYATYTRHAHTFAVDYGELLCFGMDFFSPVAIVLGYNNIRLRSD